MHRPPHAATLAALSRLLAGWLVLLLLVQGLAAGQALGRAGWHSHRAKIPAGITLPDAHGHAVLHQAAQRHRHSPLDGTVVSLEAADADDGSAGRLLAWAFAAALPSASMDWTVGRHHALPAAPAWAALEQPHPPPRRPPRRG